MATTTFIFVGLSVIVYLCNVIQTRPLRTINLDDFYQELSYLLHGHEAEQNQSPFPQPVEVQGWPKSNLILGQIAGIDTDKDDNVVAFHRGSNVWDYDSFNETDHYQKVNKGPISNDTIVVLDKDTGKLISSWGKNKFYLPHGLTIDKDGNYWMTDVALHQVFKFPAGSEKPSLVLGEAFVPGSDDHHFCKPTDVAVASTGEFFVSDGYCNSRIQKYSSQGVLQTEWGYLEGHREFLVAHSLTLLEDQDTICVADRENRRIVCYSAGLNNLPAGRMLFQIQNKHMGRVFAIAGKGDTIYAVTGPTARQIPIGLTINIGNQEIVNSWRPLKGFHQPHDLCVSSDESNLYVAEIGPNRINKFQIKQQ